jgi:hypothetical protein
MTPVRLLRYTASRSYRLGTFEAVYGRNLTLRTMRRAFTAAGLEVVASGGCGASRARSLSGGLKALLPSALWHPYLYCAGRKPS